MDADYLFTLRTYFWLGNFSLAISEGNSLSKLDKALAIERDCYVYRSYIAQGQYGIVIGEIADSSPPSLQAIKLFATYESSRENKDIVLVTLGEWLNDPSSASNPMIQMIAGIVYAAEGKYKEALQAVRNSTSLEMLALAVEILIKIDRIDLAEKKVKEMQRVDEDSTLTQLAGAWLNLSLGTPAAYQEAAYAFQELILKFGDSCMLLNGLAVANMHLGQFSEAEKNLIDAAGKNPNDADTLLNQIVCAQHSNKSAEIINRYVSQLRSLNPEHPWLDSMALVENAFERLAGKYAP